MKQRVTISFVEDDEYEGRVLSRDFWDAVVRDEAMRWCHGFSEINVSVEPVEPDVVLCGYSTMADLRRHYGCDDGGVQ